MAFFNWDDISVGNTELDNSENFFARRHYEHERIDEMKLLQQAMAKTEIIDYAQCEEISADKEPISAKRASKDNIQNHKTKISNMDVTTECVGEQSFHNVENNLGCGRILQEKIENEIECSAEINKNAKEKELTLVKCSPNDKLSEIGRSIRTENNKSDRQQTCLEPINNLASEWSTKKNLPSACRGAIPKTMRTPSSVEDERKLREFHSRPAPKFNNNPLLRKRVVHAITVPVTPQVLKRSREAEEKRKKKLEELKLKNQPPRFESRRPTVLKEKPFVPQKNPTVIQQSLFNLQTEKRLKERKLYDAMKQKELDQKRKQVEIEEAERNRREKESIRELRKATTFKARPNPFKN